MKKFRKIFRISMLLLAVAVIVFAVLYFCMGFDETYLKIVVALELILVAMEIALILIDRSINKNDNP